MARQYFWFGQEGKFVSGGYGICANDPEPVVAHQGGRVANQQRLQQNRRE
jgi:hypothetical protein